MGDLKTACRSTITRPLRSRSTGVFSAAVFPGTERHRLAPFKVSPRVQPHRSTEGDQLDVGAARFVLIVDDDPDLLDVTSFVIENEGIVVETARNGEEALALLGTGRLPAVVLLDLMMPVMNGWEFLTAVAGDPVLEGLPVVVLTAAEHAQVPGALEVLSKPMDLKKLLRVVERYVRGHRDADA
jgi:CheY-like chemotaxis protein